MRARLRPLSAGLILGMVAAGVLWVATRSLAQAGPAAQATHKYSTRVVLENDRVRVREAVFPPGVLDTGMHTHDLPHVGVILTRGELIFTEPGGRTERVAFDAGSVGYREANVTHQVGNPGTTAMRVVEVELK